MNRIWSYLAKSAFAAIPWLRLFVMNAKCPVYIVDGNTGLRRHLVEILRARNFQSVPFSTGADFMEAIDFLASGIVLLELNLPDMRGAILQEELQSRRVDMPIIAMTASGDIPTAVQVIKRGAVDFLEKPFDDSLLFKMLAVAQPVLKEKSEIQKRKNDAKAHLQSLTKKEWDIMQALSASSSSGVVADELHLSIRTVEMHRASIMKKFGVKRFTDAIHELLDAGIKIDNMKYPII